MGRIDILHAFRGPTLGMLERAARIEIEPGCTLPVVHVEDIIGLTVQAAVNDPKRATRDWADIRMMIETFSESNKTIDWELLKDYLALFGLDEKLEEMKVWYGATQ